MTFSDTVAQQREQQEKILKRFITYSLAGSFALHGVGLCLKVNNFWNPDQAESGEIAIVVTESPEEEFAEVVPPEESFSEPDGGSGGGASGGASREPGAATFLESPPAAQTAVSEPPVQDEPVAEEEPEPEPTPVPLVEDVEETVTGEAVEEELIEDPSAEPDEDAEVTPESRDLSSLLGDLRRAREQARQAAANRNSTSTGNGLLGEGDRGSTTAVGPAGSGSGFGSGSGNGNGSGSGTGSGHGSGTGTGEGTGSGEGNGTGEGNRPRQGSRSREITCSDCDFDYPDAADGAEGTAQVIVETDAQGRVVSVMLSRSTGNAALDRAALEQARRRVRLNNARAGESYPIDIDFVQPNSEAARRVRARGDRRSITVSDPDPVVEAPAPTAATSPSPTPEPTASIEPTPTPKPSASVEPSSTPALEPRPSNTTNSEPSESTQPVPEPRVAEPIEEPDLPAAPPPSPEPSNSQAPSPASSPDPVPSEP